MLLLCTYLFCEDILGIDKLVLFSHQVSPQRGSGGVQRQVISLLVTVAQECTKPVCTINHTEITINFTEQHNSMLCVYVQKA